MGQLTNLYVSQSYQGLLKLTDSTTGLTSSLQTIQDGLGGNSPLQMSLTAVNISGSFSVNGSPITGGTGSAGTAGTSGTSGVAGSSGTSGTSGLAGSSGTSGTSGQDGSSGTSGTSGLAGSSGTSGTDGSSGTSGQAGSSGTSGTDGSSGTSGVSPSVVGFITTGSITTTQVITGSLILGNTVISGSLIGNSVNSGIIKIQSQLNTSSSAAIPFGYVSSSNPDLQTNIMFGTNTASTGSGLLTAIQTGSIVISGSNNIILNSNRNNTLVTQGTYGYIGGGGNIGNVIPTLGTGSLLRPSTTFNFLNSALSLQFTTSSLVQPSISNNLIYNGVTLNHQSGSVSLATNGFLGGGLTSTQNVTTPNTIATIAGNLFTSNLTTTLSHNSSSILYQGNIGAVVVTNNYSSSVSTAVDNIAVTTNLFNGNSITLVASGSNTANRRTFNSNLISGRSNIINSDYSGGTGGHLVSTTVLGQELIVSASNTSTTVGGSTFVGRYNATGSLQESSQDAVFVVGTGTGAGNRRNALHIDNGNNTRMTGSVSITGSLSLNGVSITGGAGSSGTSGTSGTLTLAGTTDNGVITLNGSAPNATVESNMTFNGSTLSVTGVTSLTGSLRVSGAMTLAFNDGVDEITSISAGAGTILYRNANKYVTAIGEFTGTQNKFADGTNNILLGGFNSQFSTGSQNFLVVPTGGNFKSGSINIIIGNTENITSGSQNILIGQMPSSLGPRVDAHFVVKSQSESNSYLFKSGSGANVPIQIGFPVQVTGSLNVNGNTTITGSLNVSGNVLFASGSNTTMGTFVLDGANPGAATISNSLVSSTSLIFLTKQTNVNSGAGTVSVTSKGSGTFSVTSNHNGDTDTVAYLIINPA